MTTVQNPAENLAWYAGPAEDVAGQLGVDPDAGLDTGEAERRLAEYGPNELLTEPPPSLWAVARGQPPRDRRRARPRARRDHWQYSLVPGGRQ